VSCANDLASVVDKLAAWRMGAGRRRAALAALAVLDLG